MITATATIAIATKSDAGGDVRAVEEAADRRRDAAHDAREDDEADAVADALLGDQLAEPHQDDRAGGERDDLGQRLERGRGRSRS